MLCAVLWLAACSGGRTASQATPEPTAEAASPLSATGAHDVDRGAIDASIAPGDDFFRYANGTWLKKTEIPADRSSYGAWSVLFDRAQQRTRELLEKAAAGNTPAKSDLSAVASAKADERKIGDYYATYMDERAIEKKGL